MRFLIAEDDFTSRKVLLGILQDFAPCDATVNGVEALAAFIEASKAGEPYDLVCLDIMMPEMDGQEALVKIREYEAETGVLPALGAKIIMTTALGDFESIVTAFSEQCEAYIVKPLDIEKITTTLAKLGITKLINK